MENNKEKKAMRRLSLIVIALFLWGCATPYQEKGLSGGYKETKLKKNVFRVSFKGNSFTDSKRASDFALLRCAEVTLENGYRFFAIGGKRSQPGDSYAFAGIELMSINNPRSFYTIHCFKDKPPDYYIWYEATYLARSLRAKYGILERSKP